MDEWRHFQKKKSKIRPGLPVCKCLRWEEGKLIPFDKKVQWTERERSYNTCNKGLTNLNRTLLLLWRITRDGNACYCVQTGKQTTRNAVASPPPLPRFCLFGTPRPPTLHSPVLHLPVHGHSISPHLHSDPSSATLDQRCFQPLSSSLWTPLRLHSLRLRYVSRTPGHSHAHRICAPTGSFLSVTWPKWILSEIRKNYSKFTRSCYVWY